MSDMFYIGQKDYIPKLNQMAGNAQSLAAASAASAATAEAKAAEAAGYAASASQYYSSIKQTAGRIHIGGADNGSSLLQAYGDAVVTGNVSLGGAPGAESLRADKATGTVNYSAFSGAAAGQTPTLFTRGADSNVGINLQPKGRGNTGINWGQPPARLSVAAQNIMSPSVVTIASVNTSTDTITTSLPHNFSHGDCVFYRTTQNGINAGGTSATDRWFFVNAPTSTTLTLHNTLNDALGGVSKLDITAAGSGGETLAGASLMISAANSQGNQNSIDMLSYRHTAGSDWTGIGTRMQARTDNTSQGYLEFNPPGNNYGTKLGTGNSGVLQFATGGGTQMVVANIGGTVNYARVRGGTAGNGVIYEAEGADAAIATNIGSKGAEHINFYTNSYIAGTGVRQVRITHTANANNYVELTGGANGNPVSIASQGINDADVQINYVTKGGGAHLFRTGGGAQLAITNVNNAVNYWNLRGSASGGGLIAEAVGSDAAVPIAFYAKGAGNIDFHTGGGAGGERQFLVSHTAGSATYLNVTGNTTGNYPRLSGTGETHTGIDFSANGSGNFWFRSNGGTATQLCIQGSASATANWAQVAGGAANIPPSLAARGEANVGLSLNANGTGSIFLTTGGNSFLSQARIQHTAAAVNYLTFTGGTGSVGGVVGVDGAASAHLDLHLSAKGAGVISVNSAIQSIGTLRLRGGSGVAGGATEQAQVGYESMAGLQLIGAGSNNDITMYDNGGNARLIVRPSGVHITGAPLNVTGQNVLCTGQVVSSAHFMHVGSATPGQGGQYVVIDDTGVNRWFAGISGSANAKDFWIYDSVSGRAAFSIDDVSGDVSLAGSPGLESVLVKRLAGVANRLELTGSISGQRCVIGTAGADSARGITFVGSGNEAFDFRMNGASQLVVVGSAASHTNYVQIGGAPTGGRVAISAQGAADTNRGISYTAYGTELHDFRTNGGTQFTVKGPANPVNYLQIGGSTGSNACTMQVSGTGGNAGIAYVTLGTAPHWFQTGVTPATQFRITDTPGAVNYVNVTGGGPGASPGIAAMGNDGDLDLNLTAKGSGRILLWGHSSISGHERNTSKVKVTTAALTAYTVTTRRTYFTGTAGASLVLTLPAASAEIDGQIHTVMSTTARANVTWISSGASGSIGLPASLAANTPVSLQYHHATTEWLVC